VVNRSLHDWLTYQETLHPENIELGLERVNDVWRRIQDSDFSCPVILVGGTNGKGSTVACLESIYSQAGYNAATYTSPHLLQYNERIRLAGKMVSDEQLISAFEAVEKARENIPITYFEFGTLTALMIFSMENPDIVILEVGLGGRLDAVNIVEPDISIITSIALDHTDWLGDTIEEISAEKAGIARPGKPCIIGQSEAPGSLISKLSDIGADLYRAGLDYRIINHGDCSWGWLSEAVSLDGLPMPALAGEYQLENCAAAICAVELLSNRLPIVADNIASGLENIRLAGRYESFKGQPDIIFDVAHNPAAALALSRLLEHDEARGRTLAVFAMQSNRQAEAFVEELSGYIDTWYVCKLENVLGHEADQLALSIRHVDPAANVVECGSVKQAIVLAGQTAHKEDRIIITGSFHTVAEAKIALSG